jgi:hypothetical protein
MEFLKGWSLVLLAFVLLVAAWLGVRTPDRALPHAPVEAAAQSVAGAVSSPTPRRPGASAVARTATVAGVAATAEPFRIDPAVRFAGPYGFGGVVIGDVIGDRRPDIIVVAETDFCQLFVYEQRVDGSLAAPVISTCPSDQETPNGLALIDLDGTGKAEIVVGQRHGLTIYRLVGTRFQASDIHGTKGASHLGVIDVDLDGIADIYAQYAGEGAEVYYGNGFGGFREIRAYSNSAAGYNTLEVSDFTADGAPDIFLTNGQGSNRVWIMVANPDPRLGPLLRHEFDLQATLRLPPWGATVADFNQDSRPDVAVSDRGDGVGSGIGIRVLRTNGTAGLVDAGLLPFPSEPGPIIAADLDGNSRMDVVTLYHTGKAMAYRLQNANGFAAVVTLPTPATGSPGPLEYENGQLAVADVNSDRCRDIVVAEPYYGLLVYYGRNCHVPKPRMAGPGRPRRI